MRRAFSPLKEHLGKLLKEYQLEQPFTEYELKHNWNVYVPRQIATVTTPEKIENGVLFIRVSNDLWKKEINIRKKELMEMINSALSSSSEKIRELRIL